MLLVNSEDDFLENQLLNLFKQNKLAATNDDKTNFFLRMKFSTEKKNLIIFYNREKIILNMPLNSNELINNILEILRDFSIEKKSVFFFPYSHRIIYLEKEFHLGNSQATIINNLLLNINNSGLNKKVLYSLIWPRDKTVYMNKLDTHLTNLKNSIFTNLNLRVQFRTENNIIKLNFVN